MKDKAGTVGWAVFAVGIVIFLVFCSLGVIGTGAETQRNVPPWEKDAYLQDELRDSTPYGNDIR